MAHEKEAGKRSNNNQVIVWFIILLGLFHAALYALVMPPWGLLDESQHFHYVQFIVEEHRLPVMWQDRLSEEVVDSFFATERYVTLGSDQMPNRAEVIVPGRLDSESYEAYQPPLYYLLLSLLYPLGPDDVLSKLFFLRFVGVLLSGITLVVIWRSSRLLFPQHSWIAIAAALFVALLPERAVSMARLNNDVLLEVLCALSFGLLAAAIVKGFTWRKALLVGLALGLAALTKLSALLVVPVIVVAWAGTAFRRCRRWQIVAGQTLAILAIVAAFVIPLFIRNVILYQDLTGANAFLAPMGDLVQGSLLQRLAIGVLDLFRNSWVILWDGLAVAAKPSATLLYILLALTMLIIAVAIIAAWFRKDELLSQHIVEISLAAFVLVSLSVLLGYVKGFLPTVQGRFLLPVVVPTAWLIGMGLWLIGRRWRGATVSLLLLLEFVLGMSVLFFHALPKYYAPRGIGFLGYWRQTVYLFSAEGLFWDKPDFINPAIVLGVMIGFALSGLAIVGWGGKRYGFPFEWVSAQGTWRLAQRKWREMLPDTPEAGGYTAAGRVNQAEWFKRMWTDPLLWVGLGLLIAYLGWVSFYPPQIFWSLDEGGKLIHLQSIIKAGDLGVSLPYPGRSLDPNLKFVPLFFWSQIDNQIYSWWPIGFPMITIPFYLAFGWVGLYVLPAAFGALSAVLSGALLRRIYPPGKWLAAAAALIVGTATPIAFYSTTFWEHTLNAGFFLGGIWTVLWAWERDRIGGLALAAILFSLATYLRTDTAAMAAGVGLTLLLIRWRWAIVFGVSYIFAIAPWLFANWLLMGHFLGRQWLSGATSVGLSTTLFLGVREAGGYFIPYTLFNAPAIAAFSIPHTILIIGTILSILAVLLPFFKRFLGLLLLFYAGLLAITGWVLFQTEGYRSVHGFILTAPHIVFGAWLYTGYAKLRRTPFPLLLVGISFVFASAYFVRGWVGAGGLQWGPRYLIIFYPLFVVGSLGGLALAWERFGQKMKYGMMAAYIALILIGQGYQVRGLWSALDTRQYYQQTEEAVESLDADAIVTHCPWLTMVMPNLYWTQNIYTLRDAATIEDWRATVQQGDVNLVCAVEMDLCDLTFLDDIAQQRAINPGGIQSQCFSRP